MDGLSCGATPDAGIAMVVDQEAQQNTGGIGRQAALQHDEHVLQQRALVVRIVLQHLRDEQRRCLRIRAAAERQRTGFAHLRDQPPKQWFSLGNVHEFRRSRTVCSFLHHISSGTVKCGWQTMQLACWLRFGLCMRVQECSRRGHLQLVLIVCFVMRLLADLRSAVQLIECLLKPTAVSATTSISAKFAMEST